MKTQRDMTPSRTIVLAVLAILLPTVIFASVIVAFNAYNSQREVKAEALERARRTMNAIDADLARSAGALRVLATSQSIKNRDWTAARARADEIKELNDDWRTVTLLNLDTGASLFTTTDSPQPPLRPSQFGAAWRSGQVTFGGVARREGRCTCALMAERIPGEANYALVVELEPSRLQAIMLRETPPGAVSAVVDRAGHFLGRSLDYQGRVGRPATIFVRRSLQGALDGFYEGKTYEGLENLTAFVKSPVTGWSTHMAVSSELIGGPQRRLFLALSFAAALALVFAGAIIWILLRSLAQRRAMEAAAKEAQHLEALGRLTGGIAHDFNNMLAVISGNLELAQRSPDLPPKVSRNLDVALQGVQSAADLIRRMLSYARRQNLSPRRIDPRIVLRDIASLLERTIGDHIHLRCVDVTGLWPLLVDASELQNAIINLAVNARDAMPRGGEIVIRAFNAPAGEIVCDKPVESDCVVFSVRDTGEGIPREVIDRVTDPFFTTKEPGQGTGLGLSQVLGFAKQSSGDLRITSTEGISTEAFLILPRHREQVGHLDLVAQANVAPQLGPLRIMLVEDEARVLETLQAALSELGQQPTSFSRSDEALAELLINPYWDLVMTDNQMPGTSGVELIQRMRELGIATPALIISALPVENAPPLTQTLQKPFSFDQVRAAIFTALSQAESV